MECVANHDTTDSRAFAADVCSFRDLIVDCSLVAMPQFAHRNTLRLHARCTRASFVEHVSRQAHPFPEVCPQVDFDPTVWRTQCGVSELVMYFSRVWRSMTCFCQQEILDRLLFSDATCQEDISTCGPTPVRPLLSLVFESIKVCATFWCMCTKSDRVCVPRHSLVLRCFVRVWEAIRLS